MADAITNYAAISVDAPNVYIAAKQAMIAERNRVLGEWGTPHTLPQRNSKTIRVDNWQRLALPSAPLTEGVPPDAVALALDYVDAAVEQWGLVVLVTDIAEITVKHSPIQGAIDRTGLAISEVDEREIANVLLGGTNVVYPGAITARSGITATDYVTTAVVLKTTQGLRQRGAPTFEGSLYGGVMCTQFEADLLGSDTTFQNASNFARVRKLEVGEIGIWMGVQWQRSNFLPSFLGVAVPGTQSASVAGYTETGAGSLMGSAKFLVVSREAGSGLVRKVSQEKTGGATINSATITTPTSTNYIYDVWATAAGGAAASYKRVATGLAANTSTGAITDTVQAAGVAGTPPAPPASAIEVFCAFVFGRDGFGRVVLDGMSVQSYITPAAATWSNPLNQGRKIGTKVARKPFILKNEFFSRIEAASRYPSGIAA